MWRFRLFDESGVGEWVGGPCGFCKWGDFEIAPSICIFGNLVSDQVTHSVGLQHTLYLKWHKLL